MADQADPVSGGATARFGTALAETIPKHFAFGDFA
jgi:hypothetical protein